MVQLVVGGLHSHFDSPSPSQNYSPPRFRVRKRRRRLGWGLGRVPPELAQNNAKSHRAFRVVPGTADTETAHSLCAFELIDGPGCRRRRRHCQQV